MTLSSHVFLGVLLCIVFLATLFPADAQGTIARACCLNTTLCLVCEEEICLNVSGIFFPNVTTCANESICSTATTGTTGTTGTSGTSGTTGEPPSGNICDCFDVIPALSPTNNPNELCLLYTFLTCEPSFFVVNIPGRRKASSCQSTVSVTQPNANCTIKTNIGINKRKCPDIALDHPFQIELNNGAQCFQVLVCAENDGVPPETVIVSPATFWVKKGQNCTECEAPLGFECTADSNAAAENNNNDDDDDNNSDDQWLGVLLLLLTIGLCMWCLAFFLASWGRR